MQNLQVAFGKAFRDEERFGFIKGSETEVALEAIADLTSGNDVKCIVILCMGVWNVVVPFDPKEDRCAVSKDDVSKLHVAVEAAVLLRA